MHYKECVNNLFGEIWDMDESFTLHLKMHHSKIELRVPNTKHAYQ